MLVGGVTYQYSKAPSEVVAKVSRWTALAEKHGCTLPAVAMAFAALPAVVSHVVVGCSRAAEVELNLATLEAAAAVPDALWAEAKAGGLLPDFVRTP